mgnify:FL=1
MARTSNATKTERAADSATVEKSTAAVDNAASKNMDEEIKEEEKTTKGRVAKQKQEERAEEHEEPLNDSDEIEVVSLIPNVSYLDTNTSDFYEWEKIGDVEIMTFESIKGMWRKYKSYFKDMWLKPNDQRVVKKLGLGRTYEKYEYLLDGKNYTEENIDELIDAISSCQKELKISIVNKIKNLVAGGEITNINVIKALGEHLDIDLVSFAG